jgi:hypothetical protein
VGGGLNVVTSDSKATPKRPFIDQQNWHCFKLLELKVVKPMVLDHEKTPFCQHKQLFAMRGEEEPCRVEEILNLGELVSKR